MSKLSSKKNLKAQLSRLWHRLSNNPLAAIGLAIILGVILIAAFAPVIATHNPIAIDLGSRLQPPSRNHILGTDSMGRDIFSRIVFGTRISLWLGFVVIGLSVTSGTFIGGIAGFVGGLIDDIIMRFTDVCMSFPPFILAMVITATLGSGLTNVMIAISAVWWTTYARLIRGQIIDLKEETFIEAQNAIGSSSVRIFFRHCIPNSFTPVLVQATLGFGFVVIMAATLGFIGLGAQPPTPEWGGIISSGRPYLRSAWWYPVFPGFAIFIVVLGSNLLGDGLRDLLDVRLD